jgi:uncharacterized protein (DUF1800 family)
MKALRRFLYDALWIAARLLLSFLLIANAACSSGDGAPQSAPAEVAPPPAGTPPAVPPPSPPAPVPPPPPDPAPPARTLSDAQIDALRLLDQSSFGMTPLAFEHVQQLGIAAYIEEQLARPKTGYHGFERSASAAAQDCRSVAGQPQSAASLCARDNYTLFELQRQFFANAVHGEDQLRQRVAFALSQIFVVSGVKLAHAAGMAGYQNLLLEHAFGDFRELLEAVTLSPVMGVYLDAVNNTKANPASGTKPNENYARELLQLFSIGTAQLNADGSLVLADGEPVATFNQAVIQAYARVFTGWTYAPLADAASKWTNPSNLIEPMVAVDAEHDMGAKRILLDVTLPARQGARVDLEQALDVLAAHPNIGPFIGRRLIQHLVTSNPSAQYIARITGVFNDNGRGRRGDLAAVVRAILLDPEARGAGRAEFDHGRLKEPALLLTAFVRAFGAHSDGVLLRAQSAALGQNIFTAPSVFNYYAPDFKIPGSALYGPEFALFDGDRAVRRANFIDQLVYAGGAAADPTVTGSTGTFLELADLSALPTVEMLLDTLDVRLMRGALTPAARQVLSTALEPLPSAATLERARTALYLLGLAPQFQVQR